MQFSDGAYAILGMLRLGARSGYEIRRAAEASTQFFWAFSAPQIYTDLKRLEGAGLVAGRSAPRGERKRKLYELTPAGEEALHEWLLEPGELPFLMRDLGLLKLFFADALSQEEALEHIALVKRRSERMVERFETATVPLAEKIEERGHRFPLVAARYGQRLHEGIVALCDELEHELALDAAIG